MNPVLMTPNDARRLLEEHFGAPSVPSKFTDLLAWWERLRADPNAPMRMRVACAKDLDDVVGPIVGQAVEWVMSA